jgi:hypothetical protein
VSNSSISPSKSGRRRSSVWWRAAFVAGFIFVLFIGDRAGAYGLSLLVKKSQFRISRLYSGSVSVDVVVFGNSDGMYSMHPPTLSAALCRTAFNASYFDFSPAIVDALFADFVERNAAPKYALFEISNTSKEEKAIFQLRPFLPQSSRLAEITSEMDTTFPYWGWLTHLHYYDSAVIMPVLEFLNHPDQGWTHTGHIYPAVIQSYAAKTDPAEFVDPKPDEKIRHYRNILANAQRHGIQVIFFVAPHHPIFYKVHPDAMSWIKAFQEAMGPGVPILDFSHALADDALFSDVIHLNLSGSKELIAQLLSSDAGRGMSACSSDIDPNHPSP